MLHYHCHINFTSTYFMHSPWSWALDFLKGITNWIH